MKNKDVEVLHKIIKYCDDIDLLKEKNVIVYNNRRCIICTPATFLLAK